MAKQIRIAMDFDGVIVQHTKPLSCDKAVPLSLEEIEVLQDEGWKVFLWTARSGKLLDDAVEYLALNGVELMCEPNVMKGQHHWTESPKAHCELYIDDRGVGIPLVQPDDGSRPYVDWSLLPAMIEAHFDAVEG